MRLAIEEAKKAEAYAHPNPQVGAVIVRDGEVLAKGYHHKCGDLHAERDALKVARENNIDLSGSTIYVTLEPCCHFGKQPPCTQAIIESGIKRVVIGSRDPNPLVDGKGVKILEEAGIEVIQDFLRSECDAINHVFFHYIKYKTPYIITKYAMSADGEVCCTAGESKWVTGSVARENVHKSRANAMAILTGIGTVVKDDPMLNVRLDDGKNHYQPQRIVLDSNLQISLESQLVQTAKEIPVTVVCTENSDEKILQKKQQLEEKSVQVLVHKKSADGKIDLKSLFAEFGAKGIDSIFVESGGNLNGSLFFPENLVNELQVYIAPKIFGNCENAVHSPVRGKGVDFPKDAVISAKPEVEFFGDDVLLKYYFENEASNEDSNKEKGGN